MVIFDASTKKLDTFIGGLLGKDIHNQIDFKDCPKCKGNRIIKYGNYKNGQRYLCKVCGKTFSKRTSTPLYYSKKNPYLWVRFIEMMLEERTLRECSKELKIALNTAFYWRHKILFALMPLMEPSKLVESIDMTKLFFRENFKGDRQIPSGDRKQIWTIMASDKRKTILATPLCKERWEIKEFNKRVYSKVDKNSYINTYSDRYLLHIASKHNEGKKKEENENCTLKKYIIGVQRAMCRYYGVATKYLQNYLYWISLYFVNEKYDSLSLIYTISKKKLFIRCRDLKMQTVISG